MSLGREADPDRPLAGEGPMVVLKGIGKVYNEGKPNQFRALDDVTATLPLHQATVFKGPSGSGKTTLLSIIGGMTRPTTGRITLGGREITSLPERFLTEIRRKTFGFVFQQYHLIRGLSALENVMLPAYPTGQGHRVIADKAQGLLGRFDLEPKAHQRVEHLSGGEQQRVAIARALINDPAVMIADEPTAHLDTALSHRLLDILAELKAEGRTVLIASHDPLVVEAGLVDRVIELRDGRIAAEG